MDKRRPKTVNTNLIYKDPWIRVRVDKIEENEKMHEYSVVELKGGVGVVPLEEDGKIFLVGQYRYAPETYSWEIPKGAFTDFNSREKPLDTAKRELEEETGQVAEDWTELMMVHTLMGSTNDKVYLFLARELKPGRFHPEESEEIKTKKVTFDEFYEMVKRKEITDSTSITAVFLAEKFIKNKM